MLLELVVDELIPVVFAQGFLLTIRVNTFEVANRLIASGIFTNCSITCGPKVCAKVDKNEINLFLSLPLSALNQ